MNSNNIPIHDIKPIMEVEEHSFYMLLGTIGFTLVFVCFLIYFAYYLYKKSKQVSKKKQYKANLESLDLTNTKESAYLLSTYGFIFKDDSSVHTEVYENLNQKLAEYKYKKNVDCFDNETLEYIEKYKGLL